MASIEKRVLYKIYTQDDVFMGIWKDVISEFTYSEQINVYGSALQVELARNSDSVAQLLEILTTEAGVPIETESGDDLIATISTSNQIGAGTTVDENLKVRVYVFYGHEENLATEDLQDLVTEDYQNIVATLGATNGVCRFNGFIASYNSRYGSSETTLVTVLSDGNQLDNYLIQDEDGITKIPYNSMDPSDMQKDIIDKIVAQGSTLSYGTGTIEDTGSISTYQFNTSAARPGLQKTVELAPSNWFGYLNMGTNEIHFHPKPVTLDHKFLLGKHIESLDLERSIADMANDVILVGGDMGGGVILYRRNTDPASIALYGRKLKIITDDRFTDPDSADIVIQSWLDRFSQPRYKTQLTILSSDYDIESILLGDLAGFGNFGNYIDDVALQVVAQTYDLDKTNIQLDTLLPDVSKRVEDIERNLQAMSTVDNPDEPQA